MKTNMKTNINTKNKIVRALSLIMVTVIIGTSTDVITFAQIGQDNYFNEKTVSSNILSDEGTSNIFLDDSISSIVSDNDIEIDGWKKR